MSQFWANILGFEWGSKLFFLFILLLSAYLGILFARLIAKRFRFTHIKTLEFFGGAFLLLNPFAYERMMVQPVIYLGVILLGYAIYALFAWDGYKKWIWTGVFAGIALNLFLHASFMIALILGMYILLFARKKQDILGFILASGIMFLLNANWILAPLFHAFDNATYIETFTLANFQAFQTQALAPMNVWFTNIMLYGFWGERHSNHYATVEFLSTLWYIAGLILIALAVFGIYRLYKQKEKKLVIFLVVLFVLPLVFGIGIASPLLADLTLWMAEYIPLWKGYREPQKWIGIVMLVELIALLVAIGWILGKYGRDIVVKISVIIAMALLLITWSPGALWGYHGQLRTTQYPVEYHELRDALVTEGFSGRILALPWHSYLGCAWTGRPTIANPIKGLLSPLNVIQSNNIEVGSILYSNYTEDSETKKIETFLHEHSWDILNGVQIDAIVLMKQCANSDKYEWLENIPECSREVDNDMLSLYRCQNIQ